jgi:hypothetical protein
MRYYLLLIVFLIAFACSSDKQKENHPEPAVPEALQDHKKSSFISKQRSPDDLVNELYEEKLNQSAELQVIERKIKELREARVDSTDGFHVFKNKNLHYYQSAETNRNSIHDSLLKNEINAALNRSKLSFENKIANLEKIDSLLDKKSIATSDRHLVLKLFISLGMIEQYQKDNMPSAKPMTGVVTNYDKLIFKLDSAIMRNQY